MWEQSNRSGQISRQTFVEMGDGLMAYYPLEDWERFPVEGVAFREGAQIPVMVIKDAQENKGSDCHHGVDLYRSVPGSDTVQTGSVFLVQAE